MQQKQSRCSKCRKAVTQKPVDQEPEHDCDHQMLGNAQQMPSQRRQFSDHETQSHPQNKYWTIETRRTSRELRPNVIREVVGKMARFLNARITRETMIIQDETELQRRNVDGEAKAHQQRRPHNVLRPSLRRG